MFGEANPYNEQPFLELISLTLTLTCVMGVIMLTQT